MSIYNYQRRLTKEVRVGKESWAVGIGGDNPIRLQSMTNTDTNATQASAEQAVRIKKEGGELVRLTTQGTREAENLLTIRNAIEKTGYSIPLVADVHFNANAALTAASTADKVRINPGNFIDPARTFKQVEFTDDEYEEELKKIDRALRPLVEKCKANGTAIRIGVNHGSLSDRIMSRYGDTPEGMIESVMEYLMAFARLDFHEIVISIKASNPVVMTSTVRLLAQRMDSEGMHYPLHLGVTEAGGGDDGRIKSGVGIGCLLAEGYGDTIRVSLSEAPERELRPARILCEYIEARKNHELIIEPAGKSSPLPDRSISNPLEGGPDKGVAVVGLDFPIITKAWIKADASSNPEDINDNAPICLSSSHKNPVGEMASWIDRLRLQGKKNPIVLHFTYPDADSEHVIVKSSADLGFMLLHGYGSGIFIEANSMEREELNKLSLSILQASRLRISSTDYIACPSCGRTLFDLESTLKEIKKATKHLVGLKIGVMGCIVNGPGEMADADYGYVGAGKGRISLYKNKECVLKNIPAEEAVVKLIELIKQNGDWKEPDS